MILAVMAQACQTLPRPDGYSVRLSDAAYHQPAKYYLAVDPEYDAPTRPPIRIDSELLDWWKKAAESKCGPKPTIVVHGPEMTQVLPEYCTPYPDEPDCGPSAYGYFYCGQ